MGIYCFSYTTMFIPYLILISSCCSSYKWLWLDDRIEANYSLNGA